MSVLAAPMESLVAELHDGDGEAKVVHVSESTGHEHETPDDSPATHDVHVCHCAHNHLAGIPLRNPGDSLMVAPVRVITIDEVPPPPAAREALLRPPILIS